MSEIIARDRSSFRTITVQELHPTFGAAVSGVDFENTTDEQVAELHAALAKVSTIQDTSPSHQPA